MGGPAWAGAFRVVDDCFSLLDWPPSRTQGRRRKQEAWDFGGISRSVKRRHDHLLARSKLRHRLDHVDHHGDRKSTRLNSSHQIISYAVFCLKKKIINRTGKIFHGLFLADHILIEEGLNLLRFWKRVGCGGGRAGGTDIFQRSVPDCISLMTS